ncbi:MAG: 4Fe-4S dicluster domain-containing protein, partial [Hyphomicrobiaceae bacterium]
DVDRRDGYFHIDPSKPGDLADAMFAASDLVGEFEKPLYVRYDAAICAHGRSGQIGCSNCLDNCPVSAIAPAGDTVEINPLICGGCGNCSSSCPTGAVSYAYPDRADIVTRAQKLIIAYTGAGGKNPVVLFHDGSHGAPLISAMARFGRGLPVNVLPVSLYTATQLGHEVMAGILASGAEHVVVLAPNSRRDELAAVRSEVDLTNAVLSALGTSEPRTHLLVEDDPDKIEEALYGLEALTDVAPSVFTPSPQKRETARLAFAGLHENAAEAPDVIALPENAPYGRININTDGCTLCLACVSCCPANALADNPDRPQVAFTESVCVQCGLCRKTCPENVITLEARYNFSPAALSPEILNGEEPFNCIECGNPFGTKSSVEHVMAALSGKHAMFQSSDQARIIQMCDDCRVIAMNTAENPMAMGERPRVVTTEDYIKAEADAKATGKKPEDFLG